MSQSDEHRLLVLAVAEELRGLFREVSVILDLQEKPGDPVPPTLDGYRPDVYATARDGIIVAEAKTSGDLESRHTHRQIAAFIGHLERRKQGYFVLSTLGHSAGRAKTIVRFVQQQINAIETRIAVFDGCDFWWLDPIQGRVWHLN